MKQHDTTRTRSSGGAHLGHWMFGARGPLLEEEKDKAGGGQPPPPKDGEKPKDPPAAPPKDEPKTFTEDQVEEMVQQRLARDRRARGGEHKPEPPAKKSKQAESDDSTWVFDFTDAFDAAVDERGLKPTRGLKAKMRSAYQAERPDDPDAWVTSWLDDVGLKKTTTPPPPKEPKEGEQPPVPKPNGSGPGLSDKGGAGGAPVDFESKLSENPLGITDADIGKLVDKHGFEKANHMIRVAVDRKLETVKLVADPRRIRK